MTTMFFPHRDHHHHHHDRGRIGTPSASTTLENADNYDDDDDQDDDYNGNQQHPTIIDGHVIDGNDVLNSSNHLTVGSLPSSRRERRFLVSHGKQERLYDGSVVVQNSYSMRNVGNRHGHGHGNIGTYDLSKSMPVPRAPFLASRRDCDVGERLSRIPNMSLPESVTESSQASSVPYGSLNESQFRFPRSFSSRNENSAKDAATTHAATTTSSSSAGQFQDIRKKFQQMRMEGSLIKNDQGGLASLLGRNHATTYNDCSNSTSSEDGHLDSAPDPIGMQKHQKEESRIGLGNQPSSMGGIGSLLVQESYSSQQRNHQNDNDSSRRDDAFHALSSATTLLNHTTATTPQKFKTSSRSFLSSSLQHNINNDEEEEEQDEVAQQLSRSLTGLSILKTSPKGMVDLDPEEREAMASMRSRSHSSGDGNIFLRRPFAVEAEVRPSVPVVSYHSRPSLEHLARFPSGSDHSPWVGGGEGVGVGGEGNPSGENESDEFFNLDM
mmetsp:Transcript_7661/g.14463  ORF Transcript_7661/g.14463 Transcript_7661/m.14463 type:complete len:496 (+) Transcript_7661:758-2245(+)